MNTNFVLDFYREWGFFPIAGGSDEGGSEEKTGDDKESKEGGGSNEPQKYSFGGKELSGDELLEIAKTNFNDKNRMADLLSKPEKLAEYFNEKFGAEEEPKGTQKKPDPSEQDKITIAELKRLGVLLAGDKDALKGAGVQFEDDYKADREVLKEEWRTEQRLSDLTKEIDGKDGRPAFNIKQTLDYLDENGYVGTRLTKTILKDAYEKSNSDKLAKWRAEKGDKAKPNAPFSERSAGAGKKTSDKPPKKITFDGGKDSISVADAAAEILNRE